MSCIDAHAVIHHRIHNLIDDRLPAKTLHHITQCSMIIHNFAYPVKSVYSGHYVMQPPPYYSHLVQAPKWQNSIYYTLL